MPWEPEELQWQSVRALAMMGDMADRAALRQHKAGTKGHRSGVVWGDREVMQWL